MNQTKKIIGEFVKKLRQEQNLSQAALADLCNSTPPTISGLENANTNYTIDLLIKISEVLNFKITEALLNDAVFDNNVLNSNMERFKQNMEDFKQNMENLANEFPKFSQTYQELIKQEKEKQKMEEENEFINKSLSKDFDYSFSKFIEFAKKENHFCNFKANPITESDAFEIKFLLNVEINLQIGTESLFFGKKIESPPTTSDLASLYCFAYEIAECKLKFQKFIIVRQRQTRKKFLLPPYALDKIKSEISILRNQILDLFFL